MEDITFHIITPYKGPKNWLDECISSVKVQTYKNWQHHIVIDNENKGSCRNHFETLQKIDPKFNDVIVHLDGDDKFINQEALQIISNYYQNNNTWATYGNYVSRQGSVCKPTPVLPFRDIFRNYGWIWSHPRTFRAHLIPHLKEQDMKDGFNNWYSSAPDVAIFLPVLELCGNERIQFIDEDLIYYRIHNNNEHSSKVKLSDQVRCAIDLMKKPSYKKLEK